jgi:hypothetical protein
VNPVIFSLIPFLNPPKTATETIITAIDKAMLTVAILTMGLE